MSKKKITFVVNPISGTQGKEQIVRQIENRLDREQYDFDIIYTQYAGHGHLIAVNCAENHNYAVVAIGGDGTINEVARALIHTDTALGIIPCGSGNGLARHLHIPLTSRKAIDILNRGNVEVIDYGKINGQIFFCTCGVGFDAFVSLKFAEAGKRGPLSYVEKALTQSLNYKPETYELSIDGTIERYNAFVIACGNASQYGNNAFITPRASLTDGLLDITVLLPFTPLEIPELSFQLFNKTIDQNSHIKTFRCKSVHIHRTQAGVAHFDGDPIMMDKDIEVNIVRSGLKVITPEEPESNIHDENLIERAQETFINGLKQINDEIFEGIAQKNKKMFGKGKEQFKKFTDTFNIP